jgi:hypothetical protein
VDTDFDLLAKLMTMRSFRIWWSQSMADGFEEGQVLQARDTLQRYFRARRDLLPPHALAAIDQCTSLSILVTWENRAFAGESAAKIFGLAPDGSRPAR